MANRELVTNPLWGTVGYEVARLAVIQRSMAKPHSGKTSSHTAPLGPGTAPASLPTPKPRQEKQVAPGSALIHPDRHWDEPADLGCHLHLRSQRRDHHGPHSGAAVGRFKSCARLAACSIGCAGWRGPAEHMARRVRGLPRAGIPSFLGSPFFWDPQFFAKAVETLNSAHVVLWWWEVGPLEECVPLGSGFPLGMGPLGASPSQGPPDRRGGGCWREAAPGLGQSRPISPHAGWMGWENPGVLEGMTESNLAGDVTGAGLPATRCCDRERGGLSGLSRYRHLQPGGPGALCSPTPSPPLWTGPR